MPLLNLETSATCACGIELRGGGVVQFRVNKRSLVAAERGGLFFWRAKCPECGVEVPEPDNARLDDESVAKVAAIRARRWPAEDRVVADVEQLSLEVEHG